MSFLFCTNDSRMEKVSGSSPLALSGSTGCGFEELCHSLAVFQEKVVSKSP